MILKKHQFRAALVKIKSIPRLQLSTWSLICLKGRDMVNTHLCANDKHWPCRL